VRRLITVRIRARLWEIQWLRDWELKPAKSRRKINQIRRRKEKRAERILALGLVSGNWASGCCWPKYILQIFTLFLSSFIHSFLWRKFLPSLVSTNFVPQIQWEANPVSFHNLNARKKSAAVRLLILGSCVKLSFVFCRLSEHTIEFFVWDDAAGF